jgi:hypothetical protein
VSRPHVMIPPKTIRGEDRWKLFGEDRIQSLPARGRHNSSQAIPHRDRLDAPAGRDLEQTTRRNAGAQVYKPQHSPPPHLGRNSGSGSGSKEQNRARHKHDQPALRRHARRDYGRYRGSERLLGGADCASWGLRWRPFTRRYCTTDTDRGKSCNFAILRIDWDRSAQDQSGPLSGHRWIVPVFGMVRRIAGEGTGQMLPPLGAAARDGPRAAAAQADFLREGIYELRVSLRVSITGSCISSTGPSLRWSRTAL